MKSGKKPEMKGEVEIEYFEKVIHELEVARSIFRDSMNKIAKAE